jgi:phosphoribosylglycinamide formyltransferase 1
MKIGIITYQKNHLKTEQILNGLIFRGFSEISVFALPFVNRNTRLPRFSHRPNQLDGATGEEISERYQLNFINCESDNDIDNICDYYIIGGAGLLSKEALNGKRILNVHPGIIPFSRGLDSFKWAIYEKQAVGNTLHFIDENADMGEIKHIIKTPLFRSDSLATFARRHYDMEINLIINFDMFLSNNIDIDVNQINESKRRMPSTIEANLDEYFELYKECFLK